MPVNGFASRKGSRREGGLWHDGSTGRGCWVESLCFLQSLRATSCLTTKWSFDFFCPPNTSGFNFLFLMNSKSDQWLCQLFYDPFCVAVLTTLIELAKWHLSVFNGTLVGGCCQEKFNTSGDMSFKFPALLHPSSNITNEFRDFIFPQF